MQEPIRYFLGAALRLLVGFTLRPRPIMRCLDWPTGCSPAGLSAAIGGAMVAHRPAGEKGWLTTLFAMLIFTIAAYMLCRSATALGF